MCEITATCCHICRTCPKNQSAEHAPKSSWEKRRVLQNAEKKKLVLGFLHSIIHTGSPQDKSYIHSYFISGQNNVIQMQFKKQTKKNHNSRHSTVNSKNEYLHFTYLQLKKVWTGMFSFADHFNTKLKWSNHKCLIHCYDTKQHVLEPIFIFRRHSVISDSLWWQVVWPTLVTSSQVSC